MPPTLRRPALAVAALALAALALALLPAAARATPVPLASFEDAEDDQAGPGGDLDLRRFAVLADGDDLLFVVTLGAPLPPGGLTRQAVEVYLDTDATPGAGSAAGLPGPAVAFAGGRTWEAAVVLSPQPEAVRAEVRRSLGAAADRVVVPTALTVRGRTLTARLPATAVGGLPGPGWGYAVVVVDAPAAPGGRVRDVLLPEGDDQVRILGTADAPAGPVVTIPFLFGPALMMPEAAATASTPTSTPASTPASTPTSTATPTSTSTSTSTSTPTSTPTSASASTSTSSSVTLSPNLMPRLSLSGPAAAPAAAPAGQGAGDAPIVLTVTDLTNELLSAKGSPAGLKPMQFGRVVDAQGITVARVMVLRLLDQGLLATVIAGKELVRPGQVLRFDVNQPAPPPDGGKPNR